MKRIVILIFMITFIGFSLRAQEIPTVLGYSAGENVQVGDSMKVSFSGGASLSGNGVWSNADVGRVLSGFNFNTVIIPETFDQDLSVSKGYFDDFIDINWTLKTNEDQVTRFKIFRKELGTTNDSVEVANLAPDQRNWRDEYAETGVLYQYFLYAQGIFGETIKWKNTIDGIGFRIPYGVISGRVTFATGSAVEGVEIMAEADEDFSGSSMYFNGTDAFLAVSPKAGDSQFEFDTEFTFQAWVNAQSTATSTIFEKGTQYKVTHEQGKVSLTAEGQTLDLTFDQKPDTFFNVTAMRTADSLKLFVVYDKLTTYKASAELTSTPAANTDDIYMGKSGSAEFFQGYIDEVRIWHTSFSDDDVYSDVRRYISGTETGLTAYYRFNEGVGDNFYDLAREGFLFHENHGYMGNTSWGNEVPFSKQLAVKGISDENGNYSIPGIPYSSTGTNYRFIPVYDVHEFDPSEKLLYIGPGSSTHSGINFTDIAAFVVKGNVKYKDTNFPVKGANLYIDDRLVVQTTGEPVTTDNFGNYEISVPIGYHTVKVGMLGHVFRNDGYFPIQEENDEDEPTYWNFQEPFSGLDFVDTTLVKVIGRVAGGPREEAKLKGLGKTVNNIGFATIKMTTQREYDLTDNTVDGVHETWMNDIYEDSDVKNKGETNYDIEALSPKSITFYPDQTTGEFVAYLLPEKYIITQVTAGDYTFPESVKTTVDLTNKYFNNTEIDSVQIGMTLTPENDTLYSYRIDSVQYNHNLDLIYREVPSVSVATKDDDPVFWETEFMTKDETVVPLINEDGSLKTPYPIFRQRGKYELKVSVFEEYINADNGNISDKVPVNDGTVEIQNALAIDKELRAYSIDNFGNAYYTFSGGLPNISTGGIGDYLLTMSIVAKTGKNGSIMTPWKYNGDDFKAYLFGGMPTGSNFVSTGPNELVTILRDPPGSNSYAYLEKGTEFNTTKSYSVSNELAAEANLTASFGAKVITFAGLGGGVITEAETVMDVSAGIQGGTAWTDEGEQSASFSNTQTWSTSDAEDFVGQGGDVYIGYSTNIVYGVSTQVELLSTDVAQADGFTGNSFDHEGTTYDIGLIKGIRINPEFGTMFQYTQSHIERYLLPNLEMLRNNYLQSHENYTCVVCDKQDKRYGTNNATGDADINGYTGGDIYNYTVPQDWDMDKIYVDSIRFYNNQIKDWLYILKQNEKEKLESELVQNISFDGGTTYENTETYEESETETRAFEWNLGGSIGTEVGGDVMGIGVSFSLEMSYNHGESNATSTTETSTVTYGYVLNDGNAGDYISVDVKKPTKNTGPVFIKRGGQTMCPYEGAEYTQYYQPGTLLNEATMQRERPRLECADPQQVNVPADEPAVFHVQITNESETDDSQWFLLQIDAASNQEGAYISMDGADLGGGVMLLVEAGETMNKYIYVEKIRDDQYEYENLGLVLSSACQSDPTDFQEDISDTLRISASFQPVCANIEFLSPEDMWVLNTNGDTTLTVNISGYDLQHSSFNKFGLQYKSSSTSNWATETIFYVDEDEYNAANEPKVFLNNQPNVEYVFNWESMQDREYNLKATSYCVDGTYNNSEILNGIKDVKRPQVFGSPQPADGILSSGDDVMITFDEDINAGLLLPYNFSVKGVLNGNEIKHQSCVFFDGNDDYATAIQGANLDNKSWTIEFWLRRGELTEGVIFAQGGLELGFNASNQFYLKAGDQIIVSEQLIEDVVLWKHYAVAYNAETKTFDMYINDSIERELVDQSSTFVANGKMYLGKNPDTGNNFNGYIHEIRVWEKALGMGTVYAQMYKTLAGNEVGLSSYWPMDEARGDLAADKSRARNALFFGCEWRVFPTGYARTFDGASNVSFTTGASVVIPPEADFTLEFYFKANENQKNTVMFSNGMGNGNDIAPAYENIWVVGFNAEGQLYAKNNGAYIIASDMDALDNQWHHFALVKNEISNGSVYVDGKLQAYEQSLLLGGLSGAQMSIGAAMEWHSTANVYANHFTGSIDEVRIWNLARTKKHIELDMNSKLRGDEMGLVAYYPFDEYNELGIALDPTLKDISGNAVDAVATGGDVSNTDVPNIKDARPVQDVAFNWVVNEDQVVININEQPSLIEKCVLEFTIDRVEDMRENRIASPASWTAYIKQNPVIWNEEFVTIKKEAYTDYNFSVDILNMGGTEQSYQISGVPTWLTIDEKEGTIAPDGQKTINFTIDPVVNIGYYNFSLFLESDFGYPEKINIDLTVFKPTPEWEVESADFQYSMNVIGQVKIDGVISDDVNDKVAAFVNGECRGVSNVEYVKAYDNFEVYLNIYSNIATGEDVELKIWDASEGQIIADVQPDVTFRNNDLMGTPSEPIEILANRFYEAHLPLNSGWTWVSFNLNSDALLSADMLFKDVSLTDNDMIKSSTAFDIYASTSDSWFGTLASQEGITQGKAYMIKTQISDTLIYSGYHTNPLTQINLVEGWNWLGYIPLSNMSLNEALSGFTPSQNDVIKSQDAFAYYDTNLGWVGSLTFMRPGIGYLYNSKSEKTFSYPERSSTFKKEMADLITDIPEWNIQRAEFSRNMSVVAIIDGGSFDMQNIVLGAFADNECRGIIEPVLIDGQNKFFLTVYGQKEENISFRLIDRKTKIEYQAEETITYQEDALKGSYNTPIVLHFNTQSVFAGNLLEVYPNPFDTEVRFLFSNSEVIQRIEVLNISGAKIVDFQVNNGNSIVWDGKTRSGMPVSKGVYIIKLYTANKIYNSKIIKY